MMSAHQRSLQDMWWTSKLIGEDVRFFEAEAKVLYMERRYREDSVETPTRFYKESICST